MTKRNVALAKKDSSATVVHPPYFEMITEAISTLKDRTGSSQPAIAKFIEDKYNNVLPPNFKKLLSVQLKKFVKSERLVKVKNSFKVSSTEKLKSDVKESQIKKRSTTKKVELTPEKKAAKKIENGAKTKGLSQVKSPDGLKRIKNDAKKPDMGTKMKRLSQVKTPEVLKKKNLKAAKSSSRPAKKARNK